MPDGDSERILARCQQCRAIQVAQIWPDGTIKPVGRKSCPCGEQDYRPLEDSELDIND